MVGVAVGIGEGGIPNPSSSTCCGLFFAESANIRAGFCLALPILYGLNTISTWQLLPGASGVPEHSSLWNSKGAAEAILLKVIETDLDLLVTVIVNGALRANWATCRKSCWTGLISNSPARWSFASGSALTGFAATAALYASIHAAAPNCIIRIKAKRWFDLNNVPPKRLQPASGTARLRTLYLTDRHIKQFTENPAADGAW